MRRESRPAGNEAASTAADDTSLEQIHTRGLISQQVSWWPVHEFAEPRLQQVGDWPPIGSAAWCLLGERDPAKWAAILDAARHWALRVETCQAARAEAALDVAAAADWTAISRQIRERAEFCNANPWAKRVRPVV